jgi:hypothetical protein
MAPKTRRGRQKRDPVQGNDPVHSSTPQTGTSSKKRMPNIPQQAVDEAYRFLSQRLSVFKNDDDEAIKQQFGLVWWTVNKVLKQDEGLKGRLADENEFRDNVRRNGDKKFIDSLRAAANTVEAQVWYDLFEDSTFFSILDFRRSDRVLRLVVFLKDTQAPSVNPLQAGDKEGMQ